jgi:hypothetical protein
MDLPSGTYRHFPAEPADLTPANGEHSLAERFDGEPDRPVDERGVDLVGADGIALGADGIALGADGIALGADGIALGADGPGAEADGPAAEADGRANGPAAEAGRLDPDLISADGGIPVVTRDPIDTLFRGTPNSDSADRTVSNKGSFPSKASDGGNSFVPMQDCDTDTSSAGIPNVANFARKSSKTG